MKYADCEKWRAELLSIIEDARKEQLELLAHLEKKLPLHSDVQAKLRRAVVKIEKTIEGAQSELKKVEAIERDRNASATPPLP